jgi:hypothetical protein
MGSPSECGERVHWLLAYVLAHTYVSETGCTLTGIRYIGTADRLSRYYRAYIYTSLSVITR